MTCLRKRWLRAGLLLLVGAAAGGLSCVHDMKALGIDGASPTGRPPVIRPDYAGVTIPPNIAPLNFLIQETGEEFFVLIGGGGTGIQVRSRDGKVIIPPKKWRKLLETNRGGDITVAVYVRKRDGWKSYTPFANHVAAEDIDGYLCYRAIRPLYNFWRDIEVHQRKLSSFKEKMVFDGRRLDEGCVNCHTFSANKPDHMTLGLRSRSNGDCTLVANGNSVTKIDNKWGYNSWHPDGKLVALSLNKVRQFFHPGGVEVRDVVDLDSDIVIYNDETREVTTCPALAEPERMETYPCWAADGKALYFCSAPIPWKDRDALPPPEYAEVKYDLRRVSYDPASGEWGDAETIISAEETGRCIMLPRTSPDGRFLVFCMTDYGCFPIYQPASDLHMLDLQTGEHHKLPINSDRSESWHSWSSNSRWIAFSSKRRDGLFTRTYLSYIDKSGQAHKPFILPQKDPAFYDSYLRTYSFPELVSGPVQASARALVRAGRSTGGIALQFPETSMTPKKRKEKTTDPWREGTRH